MHFFKEMSNAENQGNQYYKLTEIFFKIKIPRTSFKCKGISQQVYNF